MCYLSYNDLCVSLSNTWFTFIIGERMARINNYKQAYMKEFNVTNEEYDKLYDVYALRARRYEKTFGVKLNKAKEFYWTAKLKKLGEPVSVRRQTIEKTAASTKAIKSDEKDKKIKDYIDLHFTGLMKNNTQIRRIYDNSTLSWEEKLDRIEKIVINWTAEKKAVAELKGQSGDFEYSDGSVGYETDYTWLEP